MKALHQEQDTQQRREYSPDHQLVPVSDAQGCERRVWLTCHGCHNQERSAQCHRIELRARCGGAQQVTREENGCDVRANKEELQMVVCGG